MRFLYSLIITLFLSVASAAQTGELQTVPAVDLNRYSGRWFEIAKYPNKFQKKCVGNTTATYTQKKNGRIDVLNECLMANGMVNRATGEAKFGDKTSTAKLKVRFAPSALSWLPQVWGDYWVIELASGYEYAVIGEPGREYLWILSRKPDMSDALYQDILRRVEKMGFQPGRVERTRQNLENVNGTTKVKSK
jgi:apolipoprotein D and lipocalin family protein